jgi:hypothetical protein
MLGAIAHQIALDLSPATRAAKADEPPAKGAAPTAPVKPAEDDPL